jgi:protein TonB
MHTRIIPILALLLLFSACLPAQNDSLDIQIAPAFPGGEQALLDYLKNNFTTPPEAYRTGVEGTVVASFVIDTGGYVRDATIVRHLHPAVDAEMLRLIRAMPRWTPGRANQNPVKVRYSLPMKVSVPKQGSLTGQRRPSAIGMDFHANIGAGRWLGVVGRHFETPSTVYDVGILFPVNSLRIGFNIVGANAALRESRVIQDISFDKGQKFVFGWLALEIQRPWALSGRFILSPVFSAGAVFQSELRTGNNKPQARSWGFGLHAGAMLDWVFARHTIDKGTSRLQHSICVRAGVMPNLSSGPLYQGALTAASIGYGLRIGKP